MSSLRAKAAVTGVGETEYSRGSGRSALALQLEAALTAIRDAGLEPGQIDGIIPYGVGGIVAEDLATNFGIDDLRYSAVTPMGGASCVAALQSAAMAVATGVANHVLCSIARNGYSEARIGSRLAQMPQFKTVAEFEWPNGALSPAQLYAPMARRHMEVYGTTSDQFGEIAVVTRRHALLRDNAVMTKPITLEDHRSSRMISDPFRLLDCCLESDGGAAVVVSRTDEARDLRRPPVLLLGVAEGHPDSPGAITQRDDITRLGLAKAAPIAFEMAGVAHDDIDVAALYDCFTFTVLCQFEDLGFCEKGDGGAFVEGGRLALDGDLPTNTHGGLLSQAHLAGMNHIVEIVRQLRGEAGPAQVEEARVGLVTGYGDLGDGSVAILSADL